jgi:hypothetical protein
MKKINYLLSAIVFACGYSFAQENESKVAPPPTAVDVSAPQAVPEDRKVEEKAEEKYAEAKKDPLYQQIYLAKLAKVKEVKAVAEKNAAVANAEASRVGKGDVMPEPAPGQYIPQSLPQGFQQPEKKIDSPAPTKKPVEESLPKIKVLMISGESAKVLIDGNPTDVYLGGEIKGAIVSRIDADSQSLTIKNKSGKSKTFSMEDSGPYPANTIQPMKKKDDPKAK